MTITINNSFSFVIQGIVPVIIGITIVLLGVLKWINTKLEAYDPLSKPTGLVVVCIMAVEFIDGMIKDIMGQRSVEKLGPYLGSLALYILAGQYVALLGFEAPCGNWSVTLVLALITYIMIQRSDIKNNGIKAYAHSFIEPIFLFLLPNIFGNLAPLLSMSLRLFGNNISGSIIMELVYQLGNTISNVFWSLFGLKDIFNFVGPIIATPLHLYFDLFSGAIQMYIFIMLTMVFVGNTIPDENKN
ncbi:MAG: FoF1 ATP synthase subunit a [Erysipelotrichaceae bacterium]|nr:FoF1 ATP synthase subunit a [Erysipelotrichaceae bacterium]